LSDHDAQLLLLNDIKIRKSNSYCSIKRHINTANVENFKFKLSYETQDEIFTDEEADSIFNSFLNTYLRLFNHSFPIKKFYHKHNNKVWLTVSIRISCQHKRDLYILCRSANSTRLYAYYKRYCKILREVIKAAKNSLQ
jgi:hypothetical protein